MSIARERRIWNNDTLTMSSRKRALFAAEKKYDDRGVEQLLEEDSDGADLGVACIDYDSTSSSTSDDAKDQSVPQTPNSWRMTTRSSKRKEKNRSTPLSFESRRRRNNVLKEKLINTPSSSHSFTIDTESCSNSLQDLTFNTDSENNDSKENTPVKVNSRNLRSSKRSVKKSFDKGSSKTNSKVSSPNSLYTESSNLYKTNPALCGMKTPQESIHNDAPPPRHPHNRRSFQILSDKMSPSNSIECKKRSCEDMLELSNPESKSLRNDHVSVPKARHSLFTGEAFKHFISPKSFYNKTNSQTGETPTSFSKSNSASPNIVTKPTNLHSRHARVHKPYKKKNGEINKGVKHGIRKPKHLKHSKIDVLKMAIDIIENSPLNDYIDKIVKKGTNSTQKINNESSLPKDPSLISENQLKKMDAVLQQLGCESSIYKLFHNKTFSNNNKTSTNSCDESMDEADTSEEIILSKENNVNNKFFKSSRILSQNRMLTVKLSNNIKAQVQNGKICLPKKHLKNSSNIFRNKNISKSNLDFDASDLMEDEDDIYDLGDKENINNLINQWDEEDIPLSEPQANKDFIQVMQNIKDSEDLVGGSSSKSANDSINNLNNKGITIENTTAQIVPAEDGAYLLVDDVDMSDEETQYDIEKIEEEINDLDMKIKLLAEMNNINPEVFISPPKSKDDVPYSGSPLLPENGQNGSETVSIEVENASTDKLYPIFIKGYKSTEIIENENKSINTKTTDKRISYKSSHDQYIIDAGQKKLGATQCSECRLIYQIGDPEDEKYHNMHHLSLHILKFQGWKNETICGQWTDGSRCILVTSNDSVLHWNRINQLLEEVVNPQLGFAAPLTKDKPYKVYLYIKNKMIIGCLVAEPRESANRIMTKDDIDYCSTETYPVKCGVTRIWTHSEHRQKGVATRMMKALSTSFMYGHILNNEEIAFSSPTPSGKVFIENFTKTKNFLIYLQ